MSRHGEECELFTVGGTRCTCDVVRTSFGEWVWIVRTEIAMQGHRLWHWLKGDVPL